MKHPKTTRTLIVGLAAAAATALAAGSAAHALPGAEPSRTQAGHGREGVVGGHDATTTYPWNVTWGEFFHECGGALVAPQWVLTAKHCTVGSRIEKVQVRIGSNDKIAGGEVVKGAEWVKHPTLDLALMRLATPATSPVAPVAAVPAPGANARIVGWGRTQGGSSDTPQTLQELDVVVSDPGECLGGDPVAGQETCITTREGNAGACSGDSGGPLMSLVGDRWTLVGITSRGPSDCGEGGTVYTGVTAVADWINKAAGTSIPQAPVPAPTPGPTGAPTTGPTPTTEPTSTPTGAPTTEPTPAPTGTTQPTSTPTVTSTTEPTTEPTTGPTGTSEPLPTYTSRPWHTAAYPTWRPQH